MKSDQLYQLVDECWGIHERLSELLDACPLTEDFESLILRVESSANDSHSTEEDFSSEVYPGMSIVEVETVGESEL